MPAAEARSTKLITPSDRFLWRGIWGWRAVSITCVALQAASYAESSAHKVLLTASRDELDPLDVVAVQRWFAQHQLTVLGREGRRDPSEQQLSGRLSAGESQGPDPCNRSSLAQWPVASVVSGQQLHLYPNSLSRRFARRSCSRRAVELTTEWYAITKSLGSSCGRLCVNSMVWMRRV